MISSKKIALAAVMVISMIGLNAHANTVFEAKGSDISIGELNTKIENGAKCQVKFGRKGPISGRIEDITDASFESSYYKSTGYMGRETSEFTGEIMQKIHTTLGGGHWLYVHRDDVITCT